MIFVLQGNSNAQQITPPFIKELEICEKTINLCEKIA